MSAFCPHDASSIVIMSVASDATSADGRATLMWSWTLGARNANRQVGRTICVSSSWSDVIPRFIIGAAYFYHVCRNFAFFKFAKYLELRFYYGHTYCRRQLSVLCPLHTEYFHYFVSLICWWLLSSTHRSCSNKLPSPNLPSLNRSSQIYCRS